MIIRKARQEESPELARFMLFAMEEMVGALTGSKNKETNLAFLLQFACRPGNQYSWQNCWVGEEGGKLVAAANVYDGAQLDRLRQPILDFLRTEFKQNVCPGEETAAGEHYIDTIAVDSDSRGKGFGSRLLKFLLHEYVTERRVTIGLLVEEDNERARELYRRMGFTHAGKKTLLGKQLDHLQVRPAS